METIPIHTNEYQQPQAVTTRGAIEYGHSNQVRQLFTSDKFTLLKKLDEVIADIWEHYCGANIDNLTEAFKKEARQLIIEKFGCLGVNEIREAFRLASVNVLNVNLTSYGGKVGLQVIGDCLSKYIEYRKPIVSEINREKERLKLEAEKEDQEAKRLEYVNSVINWFNTTKSAPREDCRFYKLDTIQDAGLITLTQNEIKHYIELAKVELEREERETKMSARSVYKMREAQKSLTSIIEGSAKERIIKRAKEIALHTIINDRNRS
jgi:hypothetical protein